jgi:hypothetical protein
MSYDAKPLPTSLRLETWQTKDLCYKLVDTVAKALNKKLWLKASDQGATDGTIIYAPTTDPEAYLVTGHELSHCAFGSDLGILKPFCTQLAAKTVRDFAARGDTILKGAEPALESLIHFMNNALEDNRVAYWWGQAYPGDYDLLLNRWKRLTAQGEEEAKTNFLRFMLAGMHDMYPPEADPDFQALIPAIDQAYQDSVAGDFKTCLAATKKLFEKAIRILAKEMEQQQQQQQPPPALQAAQIVLGCGGDGDGDGDGDDGDDGDAGDGDSPDGSDPQGDPQGGKAPQPTKVNTQAFRLLMLTGQSDPATLKADGFDDQKLSNWKQKMLDGGRTPKGAQQVVDAVLHGDLLDDLEGLEQASAAMTMVVANIRTAAEEEDRDEWLTQGAKAKVVFQDLDAGDMLERQLTPEEQSAVTKAKAFFLRVQGRKKSQLYDAGSRIDVQAMIQRKFTHEGPCFRDDARARGFNAMLLIDGSGSMVGNPFDTAARAALMLRKSMDFPFVDIEAWTYYLSNKEVMLSRIPSPIKHMPSSHGRALGGLTPSNTALHVAIRNMKLKKGVKRIFHLTDGMPNGVPKADAFVRQHALEGRRYGIHTFSLYIGDGVPEKDMRYMSGSKKYYRKCQYGDIDRSLIDLVKSQFMVYLQENA